MNNKFFLYIISESKTQRFLFLIILLTSIGISCKKLVEISPPIDSAIGNYVYTTNSTAIAVLTGIYNKMSSQQNGMLLLGLSADELQLYPNTNTLYYQLYKNDLVSNNAPFWSDLYNYIYITNVSIEGLTRSNSLTTSVKQQLLGEAKFMRAFFYFYLVNLFGDIPLLTTTDYRVNSFAYKSSQSEVYKQIIADILAADTLLSRNYVSSDAITPTLERVRPSKWAASALLARVYLYIGDWENAEKYATIVINNVEFFHIESDFDNVFLKSSQEAIWNLQPVNLGWNTEDARLFILESGPNAFDKPIVLSEFLFNAFEKEDRRKLKWIGIDSSTDQKYYYPFKYKIGASNQPVSEYSVVLRLAEQYLIRAEARAHLSNIFDARNDLNVTRNRAGLSSSVADTQADLLFAIEKERQVELFTEWGHRWFDLKRTNRIDDVMKVVTAEKGGTWNTNSRLFPIPLGDLRADPNLVQNEGY